MCPAGTKKASSDLDQGQGFIPPHMKAGYMEATISLEPGLLSCDTGRAIYDPTHFYQPYLESTFHKNYHYNLITIKQTWI